MNRTQTPAAPSGHRQSLSVSLVLLVLAGLLAPTVQADSATATTSLLPTSREQTSAIFDGSDAYIFGGCCSGGPRADIVRFNPATGAVTTMAATLPSGRDATSAVWDPAGGHAYIFGGWVGPSYWQYTDQIVRYEPATGSVTVMGAQLASKFGSTSAVWDPVDGVAYIFGGWDGVTTDPSAIIQKYDPATDTLTTLPNTLPVASYGQAAVWDSFRNVAYILGGHDDVDSLRQIVKFDPATGVATTLPHTLPVKTSFMGAVWDPLNRVAYVVQGWEYPQYTNKMQRFDPLTGAVVMAATLPTAAAFGSAVWSPAQKAVYAFGPDRPIVKYTLEPGAPTGVAATPEQGTGAITVSWSPPPANSYTGAITGYKVYRKAGTAAETVAATLGNVAEWRDAGTVGGTRYTYRVAAINPSGEGAKSATASALPSVTLLEISGSTLEDLGAPSLEGVAAVTVCDSGSGSGCGTAGDRYLCVDAMVLATETNVACTDHANLPAAVNDALAPLTPLSIDTGETPSVAIYHSYDRSQFVSLVSLAGGAVEVCLPVAASAAGVNWLVANGAEVPLVVVVSLPDGEGGSTDISQSFDGLGQVTGGVAASADLIPC